MMCPGCPNIDCEYFGKNNYVVKNGTKFRKDDSRKVQRYYCKFCGKYFSSATFSLWNGDHKRRLNKELLQLYASNVSIRQLSRVLNLSYTSIIFKIKKYAPKLKDLNQKQCDQFYKGKPVANIQFDDLETSIHTKLKPETVSAAVDKDTGIYLSANCASIPAKGKMAKISKQIYGKRPNKHKESLAKMFEELKHYTGSQVHFESDKHRFYRPMLMKYYDLNICEYDQYKGRAPIDNTFGEIKNRHIHDPLFTINHSFAKARAHMSRLQRRTWNTTKCEKMLQNHWYIFMYFANKQRINDLQKSALTTIR